MARNPHQHLYGTQRWRRRAKLQLRQHPLCAECERKGLVEPATQADHIDRHGGKPEAFWEGELQSLCYNCHKSKSAAEEGFRQRGYSLDVGEDGWPSDPRHPANARTSRRASTHQQGRGGTK